MGTAIPPGNCGVHGYHGRTACPRCSTSALPFNPLIQSPADPAAVSPAAPRVRACYCDPGGDPHVYDPEHLCPADGPVPLSVEAMAAVSPADTPEPRDPFADDVLERLIRSNADYQREHGHYIVPLAERLLAARAETKRLWRYVMGDDGTGHCRGCSQPIDRVNPECRVCAAALCAFMDEPEEADDAEA